MDYFINKFLLVGTFHFGFHINFVLCLIVFTIEGIPVRTTKSLLYVVKGRARGKSANL